MKDYLVDRWAWLAYRSQSRNKMFLHPSMSVGGRLTENLTFERDGPGFVLFGPYWTIPKGMLNIHYDISDQKDHRFQLDCRAFSHLSRKYVTLAASEFYESKASRVSIDLDCTYSSVEFRVACLSPGSTSLHVNSLKVEHVS